MRNTGNKIPPVNMSDTARDTINQFVFVRKAFFKYTKRQTQKFDRTIRTDRMLRETTTKMSGLAMF